MTRVAAVVMAVLVLAAYHAMGHFTFVAVKGVDPWPWVRAALAAALVATGVLTVLITAREDRLR